MISTSRHYHIILQQITKRALPSTAAMAGRVPMMLFSTAVHRRQQTWLSPHEKQRKPYRPTIERIIDPLDLDIVSSPEVRRILAQCKNQVASGKDQQPFFRQTTTTGGSSLPSDDEDGYDSDCEPMHDDWESEARDDNDDDGCSIDERRML